MALTGGKWTRIASCSSIKRSSQIAGVLGHQLVIYGGELKPREPVDNKAYFLDLATNGEVSTTVQYADADDAPPPRVGSASTVVNNALYMFSGRGGPNMTPLEEAGVLWYLSFDSDVPTWGSITPKNGSGIPAPRSYHAMTSDGHNTIYLHAGCPAGERLSDLWEFRIDEVQWKQLADAPGPPRGGTSIAYANDKLFRMGGFDGKKEQGGSIDIYDIHKDAWSTLTYKADNIEGPEARSVSCLAALVLGDRTTLIAFAGERDPSTLGHEGAGKMLGDVWAWDVEDQRWTNIKIEDEAPSPRGWFAADVAVLGDQQALLVHGGLGEDNERLDDVWMLNF